MVQAFPGWANAANATGFAHAPWYNDLQDLGFMADGRVRTLETVPDGIRFIGSVEACLPGAWDVLDAFARLDFGPWRPDGRKDINASLRSLGMFDQRWKGNKFDALWHPIPSRVTAVLDYEQMLTEGLFDAAGLLREFPGAGLAATRLQVEVGVLEVYLGRDDWWDRLWPDETQASQRRRAARLLTESRVYAASAQFVSSQLGSSMLSSDG